MRPTIRSSARRAALLAAALLAGACSGSDELTGPIDVPMVKVLAASASVGSVLELRLTNASLTNWGYNRCGSPRMQRLVGKTWVEAPQSFACTTELSVLGTGSVSTVSFTVPIGKAAGTYRIAYRFVRSDGAESRPASNTFIVQ